VNKIELLHQIVAPQLSGGWQHNYSTKTRQAGHAYKQYIYYLMFVVLCLLALWPKQWNGTHILLHDLILHTGRVKA
jgi:hypothetical protein